ncbi:rust resistance kinase Lr10-like isoform X1 [Rhododendron vialii]|uniref:rust resistance kinase Lr10-like isoform X1 n=1 Tax=Rhododendron vialii TaxID=182163 RepID=UPI00265E28AB|nr:rust resistance kinase Lr10-like isoform X1 [Rhododendron vialii]
MSSRRLFSDVYKIHNFLLVVALFLGNSHAKTSPNCDRPPSSCGSNNKIPIRHPFRVKGDPENCGNKNYELDCDNNRFVLKMFASGKYYVQSIAYDLYTIRLVDVGLQQGNCSSLPLSILKFTDPISYSYTFYRDLNYPYARDVAIALWVDCERPVEEFPLYTDGTTSASSCIQKETSTSSSLSSTEKRQYSYFLFGYNLPASVVADQCRIDEIVMTTFGSPPAYYNIQTHISFPDFLSRLEYGFELSWLSILCEKCRGRGRCHVGSTYSYSTFACLKYCDKSLEDRSFLCRLEIFYHENATWLKITGLFLSARTLSGFLGLFALLIYKFRRRHLSMFDNIEGFLQGQNNLMPIRYSYSEIQKMTRGFKEKLGEGGYGCVYKGMLRSGYAAAIKVLGKSKANGQEFINEVATIGRIHHVNVVRLIGFCATRSKRALVYEFMPNGSLEKYLFSQGIIPLSCKQMYDISRGVARGIEYLHRGCDMQILHFDIKPHNILLDENFNPKVSDFGLAKLYPTDNSMVSLTAARGTMGYMAPELFYKNIGHISYKADVYSYGMLLMEMAGRRRNLNAFADHTSQIYFPLWIYDQFKEGKEIEMGEATEQEREMVRKMVITALWCIQMRPSDRPSMSNVVEMLEGDIEALGMPPKPFLTPQDIPVEDE